MNNVCEPENDAILVSVSSSARMLDIAPRTVWTLVKDGRLKTVRLGKRVLIRRSDLCAFADRLASGDSVADGSALCASGRRSSGTQPSNPRVEDTVAATVSTGSRDEREIIDGQGRPGSARG